MMPTSITDVTSCDNTAVKRGRLRRRRPVRPAATFDALRLSRSFAPHSAKAPSHAPRPAGDGECRDVDAAPARSRRPTAATDPAAHGDSLVRRSLGRGDERAVSAPLEHDRQRRERGESGKADREGSRRAERRDETDRFQRRRRRPPRHVRGAENRTRDERRSVASMRVLPPPAV